MLCFLKRVLPFTLTLIVGVALGQFFNLFSSSSQTEPTPSYRLETLSRSDEGGGCRARRRAYFEGYIPARVLSQPQPLYTSEARNNHTQGEVVLRVTLGADGTVSDIDTITQLPDGLTTQAERAARAIKFIPATRSGSPVDEVKVITYSFNLD